MDLRTFDRIWWLILGIAFLNMVRFAAGLDWAPGPRFSWAATLPRTAEAYLTFLSLPVLLLVYLVSRRLIGSRIPRER